MTTPWWVALLTGLAGIAVGEGWRGHREKSRQRSDLFEDLNARMHKFAAVRVNPATPPGIFGSEEEQAALAVAIGRVHGAGNREVRDALKEVTSFSMLSFAPEGEPTGPNEISKNDWLSCFEVPLGILKEAVDRQNRWGALASLHRISKLVQSKYASTTDRRLSPQDTIGRLP